MARIKTRVQTYSPTAATRAALTIGIRVAPPAKITESMSACPFCSEYYTFMSHNIDTYQCQIGIIQCIVNGLHKPNLQISTNAFKSLACDLHAEINVVMYTFHLWHIHQRHRSLCAGGKARRTRAVASELALKMALMRWA